MRNKAREEAARVAARFIVSHLETLRPNADHTLDVGIILGTGWGDILTEKMHIAAAFNLEDLPGFDFLKTLEKIEGHCRELVIGELGGKKIAALRGRIHMNESHNAEELVKVVRLQVEMMFHLGIKHLILTNAAGSLLDNVRVGDVVAHNGFITDSAPPRPLYGGEFVSPEDVLKKENRDKVFQAAVNAGLGVHYGAGAMVRGPDFEGREHDKRNLRNKGATMAMMSILPEAAVAALYPKVNVYAASSITNSASEVHSHEENQRRAKESSGKLGQFLLNLIQSL